MLRRQYVDSDLLFFQEIQCLARNVQAFSHSTREHDHFRAVRQQFPHIGNLNAGLMTRSCLAPIPFARTARKELCVFIRLRFAFDLEPAPRNVINSRRTIAGLHDKQIIRTRTESKPVRRVSVILVRGIDSASPLRQGERKTLTHPLSLREGEATVLPFANDVDVSRHAW